MILTLGPNKNAFRNDKKCIAEEITSVQGVSISYKTPNVDCKCTSKKGMYVHCTLQSKYVDLINTYAQGTPLISATVLIMFFTYLRNCGTSLFPSFSALLCCVAFVDFRRHAFISLENLADSIWVS